MPGRLKAVTWSSEAVKSATAINIYLARKFSQKEIDNFFKLLQEFESRVVIFPQLYAKKPGSKLRKAVLSKELSVIYRIGYNEIFLVDILDNRSEKMI